MASVTPIKISILGDASGASKAIQETDSKLSAFGEGAKKSLIAVGAVTAAAGAATVAFAKTSVDAFKNVAGETKTLQRLTGGTAEESSRLAFAAKQTGVGL